ncbi:PREDICTED: uncharacterized protein LOC104607595 [Nelumbo nucifera]|uniref:Uncharacterized protein LOC104607595 n=2 Tax=Nelumbo nucifera TaxID=4432 RepID=A0A1U8QAB8_NELNU|nr:PREDICTED: uncharacterized protein LOC104607595 [Nelumbo nucifera]XP_010271565.1 PREDICTED: uncharacterized protein LOC104607595 [Nelumbo nucifera]XP_019055021.1 PREDICTED: uncharacterized protein LOC104607595 [Nelumbo nucifera]DAD40331.1 TPA_asm: hypothetical protein HUJ06_014654 [Nelumbo nucifera]
MGGVCAGGTAKGGTKFLAKSSENSTKLKTTKSFSEQEKDPPSFSDTDVYGKSPHKYDSGELALSSGKLKPSPVRTGASKVPQMGSILGRAGIVGLERAVDVLDTLGSSMSNLNPTGGFVSGMALRRNKISILAFEVANTIVKGANLLQSLSGENVKLLKKEILYSNGVQRLVSTDMEELLNIAAADKREEFDIFSREVIRFGDLCKDPQWHNLGRYFQKLDSDLTTHRQGRKEVEMTMQELSTLAQHTAELYHELHALDRFEQDYRRKLDEVESLHLSQRGESLMILHTELKHQRKVVRSLKKKSLWSKNLEEVVEKLVDIVTFIHQEIVETFGNNGTAFVSKDPTYSSQRLGASGLALHYANIINQIDSIVSRPSSLPPNMRDTLYHALPTGVKTTLRSRLQSFNEREELTIPQIKAEMEKTLQWLVPVAANTTRAHQGFGWVGEWANAGYEFNKKAAEQSNLIRLQTLYHAGIQKTDLYILELVTWLHHLISQVRQRDHGLKPLFPVRSPTRKGLQVPERQKNPLLDDNKKNSKVVQFSQEDRDMLEDVSRRRVVPGISKSQEFMTGKKKRTHRWGSSKSTGSSPTKDFNAAQDWEASRTNLLDVMDGLTT